MRSRPLLADATFLIEIQDELDELIAALGCLPHLEMMAAAMAVAMAKSQHVNRSKSQHAVVSEQCSVDSDEEEFSSADVIDLGDSPQVLAAAVRVRLMRLCRRIGSTRQT